MLLVFFTNLDFLILQTGHFACITNLLFFVLTIFGSTIYNTVLFISEYFVCHFFSCDLKLRVKSLHPKQYVVLGFFPIFIGFISDCMFFILCNLVKHFWQSILNTFIKWFDLNSSFNNLLETSRISEFLVDSTMWLCILPVSTKIL